MSAAAFPFDAVAHMVNQGVTHHLANASVERATGGPACAASYELEQPDRSPFADVATIPEHTISMTLADIGDLAEGDSLILTTRHWPGGQLCRISTPVQMDASGWTSFAVVPLAPVQPVTP